MRRYIMISIVMLTFGLMTPAVTFAQSRAMVRFNSTASYNRAYSYGHGYYPYFGAAYYNPYAFYSPFALPAYNPYPLYPSYAVPSYTPPAVYPTFPAVYPSYSYPNFEPSPAPSSYYYPSY